MAKVRIISPRSFDYQLNVFFSKVKREGILDDCRDHQEFGGRAQRKSRIAAAKRTERMKNQRRRRDPD